MHAPKSLAIREAMLGEVLLAKAKDLSVAEQTPLLQQALSLTQDALTIDRNLGRRLQESMRLAQLGHVYAAMGQSAKARQHSEQALVIARETNNLMTEVLCLLQLERYAEAAELAHEKGLLKQEYEACDQLYAFRSYFTVDLSGVAEVKAFVLNFGDEDNETEIYSPSPSLNEREKAGAWYLLDGSKLSGKPTQRGVYIHRGVVTTQKSITSLPYVRSV